MKVFWWDSNKATVWAADFSTGGCPFYAGECAIRQLIEEGYTEISNETAVSLGFGSYS